MTPKNKLNQDTIIIYSPGVKGGYYRTLHNWPTTGGKYTAPAAVNNKKQSFTADALIITLSSQDATCQYGDGVVRANVSGGTPPYTYSMDATPFQSSATFTWAFNGAVHTVTVKDAAGTRASASTAVGYKYSQPTVSISNFTYAKNCLDTTSMFTLQASGGTAPYKYSMDLEHYQTSNTFNNLSGGWYTFFVKDAHGCFNTAHALPTQGACDISLAVGYGGTGCSGDSSGNINFYERASGKYYTFSLDGKHYQDSGDFWHLPAGVQRVYIATNTDTMIYSLQIISNCSLDPVADVHGSSCGEKNGSITINVQNGQAPFEYSIDGINFQTGNTFTGLDTGVYSVIVRQADGQLSSARFLVINSGCLVAKATSAGTTCGYNNGTITATVTGGAAPYTYSIDTVNHHYQPGNTFTGLAAGNYTVTVKDANNIADTVHITIQASGQPSFKIAVTPATCIAKGNITLTPAGGTPPYQYSIDGINYSSSNTFTLNAAGGIQEWIKDKQGCIYQQCCTTIPLNCIYITLIPTNTHCTTADGSIMVSLQNGTAPYSYSINGGVTYQAVNTFTGLAPGDYTIIVKDANGLTNTAATTINKVCIAVNAKTTSATCNKANGSITVSASGGVTPYLYALKPGNFANTGVFNSILPGTYTIYVKDANGAIDSINAIVDNISGPSFLTPVIARATCANHDGAVTLAAANGTQPYLYQLENSTFASSNFFANLDTGTYSVMVKDANNCTAAQTVTVRLNNNLTVYAGKDTSVCQGTSAVLNATGNSSGLNYSWAPAAGASGANTAVLYTGALQQSTMYYITAYTQICNVTDSVMVSINPAPVAVAGADTTICFGQNVQLTGSGGVSYSWSPPTYLNNPQGSAPLSVKPSSTILYSLLVTDDKGCTSLNTGSTKVTVTAPVKVFAGHDTAVVLNQPLQLNAADINNSSLSKYAWSPIEGLDNAFIQNPVANITHDITYTVTAATANGCEGAASIVVKTFLKPDIFVPTAFTPNGDNVNDILKAVPAGIKLFKYFTVYNRWGTRIFYTENTGTGWDGTINGQPQPIGTFIWMAAGIDVNDRLVYRKGTVTLLR